MRYLAWGLVGVLAVALLLTLWPGSGTEALGTVNMSRVVDESVRAQELNEMLSDRYDELIVEFDLGTTEDEQDDPNRIDRERQAYAEYLAYRQELETKFQEEVNKAVGEVAKAKKVALVVDEDVVRFGGQDLSDEIIKRLK